MAGRKTREATPPWPFQIITIDGNHPNLTPTPRNPNIGQGLDGGGVISPVLITAPVASQTYASPPTAPNEYDEGLFVTVGSNDVVTQQGVVAKTNKRLLDMHMYDNLEIRLTLPIDRAVDPAVEVVDAYNDTITLYGLIGGAYPRVSTCVCGTCDDCCSPTHVSVDMPYEPVCLGTIPWCGSLKIRPGFCTRLYAAVTNRASTLDYTTNVTIAGYQCCSDDSTI